MMGIYCGSLGTAANNGINASAQHKPQHKSDFFFKTRLLTFHFQEFAAIVFILQVIRTVSSKVFLKLFFLPQAIPAVSSCLHFNLFHFHLVSNVKFSSFKSSKAVVLQPKNQAFFCSF